MSVRAARAGAAAEVAAPGLAALRNELGIPESYPASVLAEAEDAAKAGPWLAAERADARDLPMVTLDPPGSKDLDQAFHLARARSGFVVHYAIADVGAFVRPGGALDVDTHARGVTYYGPDGRFGLHPPVLSEGAGSLLPGQDRPAVLWRITLDADGVTREVDVRRAVVRSRAQLTYAQVQRDLDAGRAEEMVALLPRVGRLRLDLQIARGGAALDVPEQEVAADGGQYRLVYRAPLPVEEDNAQLSLLTGMAAAALHREAGVGIWRTLPPAPDAELARLRRVARGLGLEWKARQSYGAFALTLDGRRETDAAFATEAVRLFRGAGYEAFGTPSNPRLPTGAIHSAIGAEYAHVTAPLRRLVDRYGAEVALAHVAGSPVPEWVLERLETLPRDMASAVQRAGAYERGSLDLLEALILTGQVGQSFEAMVVGARPNGAGGRNGSEGQRTSDALRSVRADDGGPSPQEVTATVLLREPAVRARVTGPGDVLRPGESVRVAVVGVDVDKRLVRLSLA